MTHTDFPTHLIDLALNGKVLGTVQLLSNGGQIRVGNHPQYDEGAGAVVVRGVENTVSVWYDVDTRELGTDRGSFQRRDKFMVDSTPAAKTVIRDAITATLRNFLDTDEGAAFVKAGRIVAARNTVARAEAKLEEVRAEERMAARDLVDASCALARLTGEM